MIRNEHEYREAVRRQTEERERLREHRSQLVGAGFSGDQLEPYRIAG